MADTIRWTGDGATLSDAAKRHAALTVAEHATDAAELATWLDMLGLPPCERPMRSGPR